MEPTTQPEPAAEPSTIVLIDLSSIAHPIWHTSGSDPDVDATSKRTVAQVRRLATGFPRVAVCCDSGRSFRKDVDPTYKGNRPESDATLNHQIETAKLVLAADGFPVWSAPGFEADDLIATAVRHALYASTTGKALVISSDKDLLQLVGPRVTVRSPKTGNVFDEAAVIEKFGVKAEQMRDYLSLVGDAADNIKGAVGIGKVGAVALLKKYGSLDALYDKLAEADPRDLGIKPSEAASLAAFQKQLPVTRALVELRMDVEIPYTEINAERVPKDVDLFSGSFASDEDAGDEAEVPEAPAEEETVKVQHVNGNGQPVTANGPVTLAAETVPTVELPPAADDVVERVVTGALPGLPRVESPSKALVVRQADILAPAPAEWERHLEPRSMREARSLAIDMAKSRLFGTCGSPEAVLAAVLTGRELGIPAMASLRGVQVIEGKPSITAAAIRALVIRSGRAKYFRCTERTNEAATFATMRLDDEEAGEITLRFTIADGRLAWVKSDDAWSTSPYVKNPADMLVARSSSKLARLVYPEVLLGMYAIEELENG